MMTTTDRGGMAATTCAVVLFALAIVAWAARPLLDEELVPAVQLLSLGTAGWAGAILIGVFGPIPAQRAVFVVLAASVVGVLAGGGWLVLEAMS